jgi:predicted nucleic acid-binding protein
MSCGVTDAIDGGLYLDSSVVVPLFVPQSRSADVQLRLVGGRLVVVVSDLVAAELVSAVALLARTGALSRTDALSAVHAFEVQIERGVFRLASIDREDFVRAPLPLNV